MAESDSVFFSSLISKSQDALTSALNMMTDVQKNVEDVISSLVSKSSMFQDASYKSIRESMASGTKSIGDLSNFLTQFLNQGQEMFKGLGDFKYKKEMESIFNTISAQITQMLSYLKF